MDRQAQMQAIVDKLAGVPPETLPPLSALDPPWRTIYLRIERAGDHTEAELAIYQATRGLTDRENIVRDLCAMLPPGSAFTAYPSLQEISGQFSSVDWLWPSWIPRGMLTLFGASPGAGKSLVALDLARRVIHSLPFPDGSSPVPSSPVLIVDAEGAPALPNQRARAWNIDRSRLFLMLAPQSGGLIDLSRASQQALLSEMCRTLEPALVVVDSLAAATARGETSLDAARAILGFLSNVAREHHLALLIIHHLRKRPSGARTAPLRVAADDLRGSSHISAAARSVMALSVLGALPASAAGSAVEPPIADPIPAGPGPASTESYVDGPRRLEIVKTNLCRPPSPLGLVFEGENVPVPTLRYTEYVEPAPQPSQTDLCAGWLYAFLESAAEPLKPVDVIRAAREAGFSRTTLYRARNLLSGLVVDLGHSTRDPNNRWALAAQPDT